MGLRQILGSPGAPVSWETAKSFLRENYVDNADERERRAFAVQRDEFYEGRGDRYMATLIDKAFADPTTRALRKVLVPHAKWNNPIARIVNEKATVYSEPAVRSVGLDERGAAFLALVRQDEVMREVDRKLCLHEDVLLQYRVRQLATGARQPVIDVVSPALFWAIAYPTDHSCLAAILVDQKSLSRTARATDPHYRLWCDDETLVLDAELRIIREEPWPLGRMPCFLATTRPPSTKGRLLAQSPSADLVSAHEQVWFQSIMLVKESKSSTRQVAWTGDTSATPHGQGQDTETDVMAGEGVTATTLDRGMDLSQFRNTSDHILERAGANHGLPPSVLHHRDASSGAEIHLRRIPIRELRKQRIPIMRAIERQLAEIQSMVNAVDLPEYPISLDGWSIDFGEVQEPLSASEALSVFETERRLLLTDTVREERRRNPDHRDDESAWNAIEQRVANEVRRVAKTQVLAAMDGSTSSTVETPTAAQNGANGLAAREAA